MSVPTHSRKSRVAIPSGGDLSSSSTSGFPSQHYWQRVFDWHGYDVQAALDQMKSLLGTRPQSVYKTAYYRKQTKNHWARDDPAFVVLQAAFLAISVIAYSVAFKSTLVTTIAFALYTFLWNWLGMGLILSSTCRWVANQHLVVHSSTTHVQQSVEWMYAVDIHCNAFFPVFCLLYGLQFFLLPLVLGESFGSLLLANTLYAAALSWYWYVVHVGYRSLPFLANTQVYLFPIAAVLLVYVLNIVGYLTIGLGWNAARIMARFYFVE